MSAVTAAWPLPRLVSALARAGWHVLDGRQGGGYRAVLRGLCDLLPHGSASGLITAAQLADAAGLSERWTRAMLTNLETAGVITWTRGTIIAGRPMPGAIRVNKAMLADLVRAARPAHDAELARRAAATSARIRDTLRRFTLARYRPPATPSTPTPPAPRPPARHAAPRAELSATPSPYGEVTGPAPAVPVPVGTLIGTRPLVGARRAALRAAMAARSAAPEC